MTFFFGFLHVVQGHDTRRVRRGAAWHDVSVKFYDILWIQFLYQQRGTNSIFPFTTLSLSFSLSFFPPKSLSATTLPPCTATADAYSLVFSPTPFILTTTLPLPEKNFDNLKTIEKLSSSTTTISHQNRPTGNYTRQSFLESTNLLIETCTT